MIEITTLPHPLQQAESKYSWSLVREVWICLISTLGDGSMGPF